MWPRSALHPATAQERAPFARWSPGRRDTSGNTYRPTARPPRSAASDGAPSGDATATSDGGAPRANRRDAPSDLPAHRSLHWWRAHADGDGTGHYARAYGGPQYSRP